MRVLITGTNGFIGKALSERLLREMHELVLISRAAIKPTSKAIQCYEIPDLTTYGNWSQLLTSIDIVIHCAGITHTHATREQHFRVNCNITYELAKASVKAGIKRFIFISSVKALGNRTSGHEKFCHDSIAEPTGPYGESKWEAEEQIRKLADERNLEFVIIRPPLVYGPGVKSNFKLLARIASLPLPLPFRGICNRRDMISVFNLSDLILTCIDHPAAANQTFMVSDGRPYSLPELLKTIRSIHGSSSFLFRFPTNIISIAMKLLGKSEWAESLLVNLEVDISHTTETLSWWPKTTLEDTLREMLT